MKNNYLKGASISERLAFYSMPEPNSGCLLWLAACDGRGYPVLMVDGKLVKAHRLSKCEALGIPMPPPEVKGCHKCDVRACINPDHIFFGSDADNHADMCAKGRYRNGVTLGEKHPHSKLNAALVRAIRMDTRRHADIAADLGVTKGAIQSVKAGNTWRHVT